MIREGYARKRVISFNEVKQSHYFVAEGGIMREFSRLPRTALVLEAVGIVLLILSYLTLHQMLPLPAIMTGAPAATAMIFTGIALMLPAAMVLMWRTAKALAPDLFNTRKRDAVKPGEKHDADH